MKELKFKKALSELILKGGKNNTWRFFDDKDISVGDEISFLVSETKKEFAKAEVIFVKEKILGNLNEEDLKGHEKYESKEEMYKTYSQYYNKKINEDSIVKIIK